MIRCSVIGEMPSGKSDKDGHFAFSEAVHECNGAVPRREAEDDSE